MELYILAGEGKGIAFLMIICHILTFLVESLLIIVQYKDLIFLFIFKS